MDCETATTSTPAAAGLCRRIFWAWLLGRTAVWTAVTVMTTPNAPLDLVEWLAWGRRFTWGYPKHPPLPAWLAAISAQFSPGDVWGVYVLSYLLVAGCLWAAWRLGREFLSPPMATAAVMCLDGLLYLTKDPAEFSNNITLDLAWILSILYFTWAVRSGKLRWWAALGLVIGLGLLCKYTLAILLVVLTGFMVYDRDARRHWKRPGPYLAAGIALALFAPHLIWMAEHDFITLDYAAARSQSARWAKHLFNPGAFVIGQFVRLTPVLLILWPLLRVRRNQSLGRCVLDWAVLGPPAVLLMISFVTGREIRDIWGSPLWTAGGVWLLARAGAESAVGLRRAAVAWGAVAALLPAISAGINAAYPHVCEKPLRAHYAGRLLADEVTRRWHVCCSDPLSIAAGEAWRAGNVCCYSRDQPIIYSSGSMGYLVFEPRHSPWTSDADLAIRGGVILWDAVQLGDALPAYARDRFPAAEAQPPIVLPYQTGAAVAPDRVGIAFVWPKADDGRAVVARDPAPVRR